jgi:phospholipid/cholesterol/gamma-HCH transport system substrate-binding protein
LPLLPGEQPPPGGAQPQASGPAVTTYDPVNGKFVDPAGGVGVFAPGVAGAPDAENWADLMLDPRQA